MYFLSLGLWRVRVYHQQALQQIQIVYYNDQKLRLLITESEHWLSLLPQILTNRFSGELLSDGRCSFSSMASNTAIQGAEWAAHCLRKPCPKHSGGAPMQSSGQGRWPGTIWEPKCSEVTVTLPSSLRSHRLPVLYDLWILTSLLPPQRKKP